MYHIFFIHSSVDGHLGCFHVLAIVNSAAVNVGVHVYFSNYDFEIICKNSAKNSHIHTLHSDPPKCIQSQQNFKNQEINIDITYISQTSPITPPMSQFLVQDPRITRYTCYHLPFLYLGIPGSWSLIMLIMLMITSQLKCRIPSVWV